MKKIIYIYMPHTMAVWEIGNLLQGLSMECALRGEQNFEVKMVGITLEPVKSIGGLTMLPDMVIEDMILEEAAALILPGAETWGTDANHAIIQKAIACLDRGILVAAICGATLACANAGLLDDVAHTSNAVEYLSYFSQGYKGAERYVHEVAAEGGNLITGSTTGGLEWARLILKRLEVFSDEKVELWYSYFKTGKPELYMQLIS